MTDILSVAVRIYRQLNDELTKYLSCGLSAREEERILTQLDRCWFYDMVYEEQLIELKREADARKVKLGDLEDFYQPRLSINIGSKTMNE